jgi:hypothetical protein
MKIGNRRFRFIVALNRDRYVYAPNRKTKGVVVNSIVNQVQLVGGRFLELTKHLNNEIFWSLVIPNVAREKVAHALRDKYPLDSERIGFRTLKNNIANFSRRNDLKEDDLYDLVNSYILTTDLPSMKNASDSYIEEILFKELARLLNTQAEMEMLKKFVVNDNPFTQIESIVKSIPRKYPKFDSPLDFMRFHCMHETEIINNDSVIESITQLINIEPARCTAIDVDFLRSFDDVQYCGFVINDLPENFSERDCEELISTLDYLANSAT